MARALQRTHLVAALAVGALVALSLLVHWLASRRFSGLWIMPDEATYVHRALRLYQEGKLPLVGSSGAGYGVVYPIVAGLPLSIGSFATGDAWLKPLQALVVSLAAVPVFLYARRLVPPLYAVIAAALTLASPLLLYSGLVMTEVVFYPIAAFALLAVARAVASTTLRDQAIALALIVLAVLARTQAVAFVGVFAGAALIDALLARDLRRLRAFWPVWALVALAVLVGLARPGVLGAYATTIQSGYPVGAGIRMTYDHLAYVVIAVGVIPAAAFAVLLVEAARGREHDAQARALIAVTAAAVAVVVVQVGFFAARFAHHVLGRDLAALPPLLFTVFALWLARGGPGRVATATLSAFAVLAIAALAPWNDLSSVVALPDSFDLSLLEHLRPLSPADVVTVGALGLLALFVLVPRRWLLALPVVVLALLTASSVVASNTISGLIRTNQAELVGPTPDWIDQAAQGDVTYLYDGEELNIPYQEKTWNSRITHVLTLRPYTVSGPIQQTSALLDPSGRLPITTPYVVASDVHRFVGTPVAHLQQTGVPTGGLTLWRLSGPPRISMITNAIGPNGDMTGPADIDVYGCRGGELQLTLLPKSTKVVRIDLDGKTVATHDIAGLPYWNGTVYVPASQTSDQCRFTIFPQLLLGSTRIAFERPAS
jgi:hypothetical protein